MITNFSILIGYILDLILGAPYSFPHPVKYIGRLISFLEKKFFSTKINRLLAGFITFVVVAFGTYFITMLIVNISYNINNYFGIIVESMLVYTILSARCLGDEAMKVYRKIKNYNLSDSRTALSYIVGRDTSELSFADITRAVIETVAENTVDGVLTPIFCLVVGGVPFAMMFKAVSTLDSMIGYRNERYELFGKVSARADDVFNFIPARLSTIFFVIASILLRLDTLNSIKICIRDRKNHLSPNCAYPESLVAGALQIKLGGDHYYAGKLVKKPTIGDEIRTVYDDDIVKAVRMLHVVTLIAVVFAYYVCDMYMYL